MSYDIVYNRQFIKADDKYIPLVLIGSNNLWENTYGTKNTQRRVRNWSPIMNCNLSVPFMTASEIMEKAQSWTGGEYQQHFKWHSKWVNDKGLLSFFRNGIKNAASIEELKELSQYPENVYLRCHLSVWFKNEDNEQRSTSELFRIVHNTEELITFMSEAAERLDRRLPNENGIHVCVEFPQETAVQYPKEYPKRRMKPERLNSDFWVIMVKQKSGGVYYISKLTPGRLHYAYTSEYAKQFKSHPAAAKWASDRHIQSRFGNIADLEYQHVA